MALTTPPVVKGGQPSLNPFRIVSPWTAMNYLALLLNGLVCCATFVTYQRILGTIEAAPCLPEDGPILPRRQRPDLLRQEKVFQEKSVLDGPVTKSTRLNPLPFSSSSSSDPDKEFHIIFSTGCTQSQHMQSYVLFHSIMESGQRGQVTRIASGCTAEEADIMVNLHETQIVPMGKRDVNQVSRFHLHLTPEFGKVKGTNGQQDVKFHYLNKPYGVAHWMEHVLGYSPESRSRSEHDDVIICLLDPDMVILRPIVNDFSTGPEIWRVRHSYPLRDRVQHGFPFSQEYGFLNHWYLAINNVSTIFPPAMLPTPVNNMTKEQIIENYSSGPPYLVTARDFYQIVALWRQLSIPIHQQSPKDILTEMYAYSWAAAHLKLPHQQAHSFMVSSQDERGFHLFDDKTVFPSNQMCRGNIPVSLKPHILHYCQRWAIGKYVFGKHRLPKNFVGHPNITATCASPLMAMPPTNVSIMYDFFITPESNERVALVASKFGLFTKQEHLDRVAFMLCESISAWNQAARYFKEQHCAIAGVTPNLEESLKWHESLQI
jgi:peptidyl serine alpha-galactosyltransferase